jgi:hypothetical protein
MFSEIVSKWKLFTVPTIKKYFKKINSVTFLIKISSKSDFFWKNTKIWHFFDPNIGKTQANRLFFDLRMVPILLKNVKKPPFCHDFIVPRDMPYSKKTRKNAKKRQNTGKSHIYKNRKVAKITFWAKIDNFLISPNRSLFSRKSNWRIETVKIYKTKRQMHTQKIIF